MGISSATTTSVRFAGMDQDDDSMEGCTTNAIVSNANDAGSGSLRQAVIDACPSGTIQFAQRFQIQLLSEIVIDRPVTIDAISVSNAQGGIDDALVQIKGGTDVRAFNIAATGDLTLRRVRISNGVMTGGGVAGAILNSGALAISECRLDGNRSGPGSSNGGGAIRNNTGADLYVENTTFDHNVSHRGAAIFNFGDAELYNSTFSANTTDNGADVKEGAIQNRASLFAVHITVTDNGSGGVAGGLFAFNADTVLINSIFAGNNGNDCQIAGGTFDSVGLLKQTGNCASQISDDPVLGALADNGGVTATHMLAAGSPALGVGDDEFCPDRDQRGIARTQPNTCDIGAVEYETIFADGFE